MARSASFELVVQACLSDALDAFGLAGSAHGAVQRLLRRFLNVPVSRIARQLLAYDAVVGAAGLQQGGAFALREWARGVRVRGLAQVPRRGPLLLVANHPGLTDAAALFSQLPRADLRVIAARRPLLARLPETARHLLFVPPEGGSRLTLIRQAARHMRQGGAVLTFPGGRIEPDPALLDGAVAALEQWSPCVDSFARLVPDLAVVPVVVSGVLSPAAYRHPLTRLRRSRRDREWLAATLQMLLPALADVTPHVLFGAPVRVAALDHEASVRAIVQARAARLLQECEAWRAVGPRA